MLRGEFNAWLEAAITNRLQNVTLDDLAALGRACGDVTKRLRRMSAGEREFWATRAYQATDRRTRRHQASYGRRRSTHSLSQWMPVP